MTLQVESEAEIRRATIQECLQRGYGSFLLAGSFLKAAKGSRDWETFKLDNFAQYVEQFHIKYKQGLMLIAVYEVYYAKWGIGYPKLITIGQSKLEVQLPKVRKAQTKEEVEALLEDAERSSIVDLAPHGEKAMTIYCLNCGTLITNCPTCNGDVGAKWVKGHET